MKASKPNFDKLLEYARPSYTIGVRKLDQLGRNNVHLIELVEELNKKGIHPKSLSESIDTTSAIGMLLFQFMCILAEHERNIIREHTAAGLYAARARGEPRDGQRDYLNSINSLPRK